MVEQRLHQFYQVTQPVLVNNQTVEGVAHADATCLGIVDNGLTHLQVALLIEIGVDNTGSSLNHRDAGCVADEVNQSASASWYAEVYVANGIQHLASSLMGGRQEGDYIGIDPKALQHFVDEFYRLLV